MTLFFRCHYAIIIFATPFHFSAAATSMLSLLFSPFFVIFAELLMPLPPPPLTLSPRHYAISRLHYFHDFSTPPPPRLLINIFAPAEACRRR
jgi:hypothetical protein